MLTYNELREKALSENAKKEDRLNLLQWCEENKIQWNGIFYDTQDGITVKPIYEQISEDVEDPQAFELVDAEIEKY